MDEILREPKLSRFPENSDLDNSEIDSQAEAESAISMVTEPVKADLHKFTGNDSSDAFHQKVDIINNEKHRIETVNYFELSPELIREFSDFYLEIFRNAPYNQFLLHKDDPLTPISPQEAFNQPDKKYFSLEELENFDVPDGMFHWMDRDKTHKILKEKLEDKSFITRLVDNQTSKTQGLICGRRTTLKDIFETEEMKNPLLLSKYFDRDLIADEKDFFQNMKKHCDVNPETPVFFVSFMAIHPKHRGLYTFYKLMRNFTKTIPVAEQNLFLFAEVEHSGAGYDIDVALSDRIIHGVLKNGHPIVVSEKAKNYAEVFLRKPADLFKKLKAYKLSQLQKNS